MQHAAPHQHRAVRGARTPQQQLARPQRRRAGSIAAIPDQGAGLAALEQLRDVRVERAVDGEEVELPLSVASVSSSTRTVAVFLTHFGDLGSWELGQRLASKALARLRAANVRVVTVGLGDAANARKFAELVNYPVDDLYADADGAGYKALGFSPGFGTNLDVSAYLKLLPMLAGVGSPGTMAEVLRGYVGDANAPPIFDAPDDPLAQAFGAVFGRAAGQRPLELATRRLLNMVAILRDWSALCPPNEQLLVQQGGVLAWDARGELLFRHDDAGILKTADVDALLAAVLPAAALPAETAAGAASRVA